MKNPLSKPSRIVFGRFLRSFLYRRESKTIVPDSGDQKYAQADPLIDIKNHKLTAKITMKDIRQFRELMVDAARPYVSGDSCVALSGGVDSLSVLFALMEAGKNPTCYTFYMDGYKSPDLVSAKKVCKAFDLDHVTVAIPSDPKSVYEDIIDLMPYCEFPKPTIVQCLHPWKYLLPNVKEKIVLTGDGGDNHYGLGRSVEVPLHAYGELNVLHLRGVDTKYSLAFSGGNYHRYTRVKFNKEMVNFYAPESIERWFLQFTLKALNTPYQKWPTVLAFKDYFDKGDFYRKHLAYQKTGIKSAHDAVLNSAYNTIGAKSITAIYNDIYKRSTRFNGEP